MVTYDSNELKAIGQGTGTGAGTNTSGFSALLGGVCNWDIRFGGIGSQIVFWSLQGNNSNSAPCVMLSNADINIYGTDFPKEGAFSVRCLKN
jgi:uncharacterized protein (TIGR02145 family)